LTGIHTKPDGTTIEEREIRNETAKEENMKKPAASP
jgi:hypothetical protein